MATAEAMATGETMAMGERLITGKVMATGGAEVYSVQTTLDHGIVASALFRAVADLLASSSLMLFYTSCLRVGP